MRIERTLFTFTLFCSLFVGLLSIPSTAQSTLSLDELIQKTLASHPSLDAAREQISAAKDMEAASGYLSDPNFSLSWMGREGPFKNGQGDSSKPSWSISQSFAFPSNWWNMQKALSKNTEAAQIEKSWLKSELVFEATRAYWNLALAQENLSLLQEEKTIIQKHKRNTTLRPVRNELVQAHLLEVDEDLALLENNISLAGAQQYEAFSRVQELTAYSLDSTSIPQVQIARSLKSAKLDTDILGQDLRIRKIEALKLSQAAKVDEARSSFAPTFQASFKSLSEDSPMPNGKELMLGISLPFAYFWQKNAQISVEQAKLKTLEAQQKTLLLKLRTDLMSSMEKISSSSEALERLKKSIIPTAKKRYNLLSRISATDMETLMQKYMAGKKLIRLKQEEVKLLAQIATMTAWVRSFGDQSEQSPGGIQ